MGDLIIDRVEIIDFSTLVDPTDDSRIVGVHSADLTGWYGPVSPAVATFIEHHLAPRVIGTDPTDHQGFLARTRRASGQPINTLNSWALGALDCAMWDLHGRAEGVLVAELLTSSKIRTEVPAYASWLRLDIHDPANSAAIARVADQGWLFTKWGLRRDRDLGLDEETTRMAEATKRVIETVGASAAFDALCTWDLALASRFIEHADHSQTIWLEEPLANYDLTLYATLATTGPPLALGERLEVSDDPRSLLNLSRLGALTIDVVGYGGLTAAVGAVAAATRAQVPVHPHGRSLLPAIHLAAAFPATVTAIEYQLQWQPRRQRLFTAPIECARGQVAVPSASGLGLNPRRP